MRFKSSARLSPTPSTRAAAQPSLLSFLLTPPHPRHAVSKLPLPTAILFVQLATTVLALRATAAFGLLRLPPLTAARAKQLLPISLCYALHAALVLWSLAFLNVPMYNTLKRTTPVLVLVFKV